MAKQRGRPISAQTLEKERIKAMFANPPAHISELTLQESEEIEAMLAASKKIEDELIADYGPTIPNKLIFEVASLGDESMHGHEETVLKKYNTLVEGTKRGQKDGAAITAQKAHDRAKAFWDKNPDLFEAMGRPRNANTSAQRIIDNWPTRGDGKKVPNINTIKNWYKLIQNSKGSLG
jgi:hypothetical protein